MASVKLSVSLSPEDLARLDRYADATGLPSRSAAIQKAIGLLGDPELAGDYAAAWDEWVSSGDEQVWEATSADGLGDGDGAEDPSSAARDVQGLGDRAEDDGAGDAAR